MRSGHSLRQSVSNTRFTFLYTSIARPYNKNRVIEFTGEMLYLHSLSYSNGIFSIYQFTYLNSDTGINGLQAV